MFTQTFGPWTLSTVYLQAWVTDIMFSIGVLAGSDIKRHLLHNSCMHSWSLTL